MPTNEPATISFTPETRNSFKQAYKKAVKDKAEQFTWDGHDFVTNYAKYMIEYLDGQSKAMEKQP